MIRSKIAETLKNEYHRNSLIYLSASVLSSLFSFILIVPLSKHLSEFDMGIVENFLSISILCTGLITYGMDAIVVQNFKAGKNLLSLNRVILFLFVNSIALSIVFFSIKNLVFPKLSYPILIISLLYSIANTFYTFYIKYLQLEKKALRYSVIVISYALLNFFISIVLIIFFKMDYWGRLLGYSVPIFLVLPYVLYILNKTSTVVDDEASEKSIKDLYRVGFVLFIGTIGSWVLERADRLIISGIDTIENAGVYGIGYQLGSIVLVVQSAISRAWLPNLISGLNGEDKHKIKKDIFITLAFLFLVTISVCIAGVLFLKYFIDVKFEGALYVIIIISFAYFLDGIWKLYSGFIIYHNRYSLFTAILLICGTFNIICNFILIPRYSIEGAAMSTLISSLLGSILTYYFCKKNQWL